MFALRSGLLGVLTFAIVTGAENVRWVEVGQGAVLKCPTNNEIGNLRLCLWNRLDHNGNATFHVSFISNDDQPILLNDNYNYTGNIIHECGLVIRNVSESDITLWQCNAAFKESKNVHMTNFQFKKGVRASDPEILDRDRLVDMIIYNNLDENCEYTGNITVNLTCCSEHGIPNPDLVFKLGDEYLTGIRVDDSLAPGKYCVSVDNATFLPVDNEKVLGCVQSHPTFAGYEIVDEVYLNISYGPELLSSGNATTPNDMFFVISSNPKPEILATIDDGNETLSVAVEFYFDSVIDQGNFTWNVTWYITEPSLDLRNKSYLFTFTNPYGDFRAEIPTDNSTQFDSDIAKTQDEDGEGTLVSRFLSLGWSTTWIMAVPIIAILACFLAIAIPKICCRKKKSIEPDASVQVQNLNYPIYY